MQEHRCCLKDLAAQWPSAVQRYAASTAETSTTDTRRFTDPTGALWRCLVTERGE